jgi:hypothetical protein
MKSTAAQTTVSLTLEEQLHQLANCRFLAMPLAGTLAWIVVGIGGCFLPPDWAGLVLFIATGSIFYLGLLIARFTGEDLLGKTRKNNFFDKIYLSCVFMCLLVFAIAIPFYRIDPTSLPLTVGILTGLMWLPFSVLIRHWVGTFHAVFRTLGIVVLWHLLPEHRFVAIPALIVVTYLFTLYHLARRERVA